MGLKLTTDRYPPITSQTRYTLRHASLVSIITIISLGKIIKVYTFFYENNFNDSCPR